MNTQAIKILNDIRDKVIMRWGPNDTEFTRLAELSLLEEIRTGLSSPPSLDIDSLQRYDYYSDIHGAYMDEDDNGEYVRYASLVDSLRN